MRDVRAERLTSNHSCRLELGAGGGLVGLALALAMHSVPHRSGTISSTTSMLLTDQIPMLSLMHRNIELNRLPPELVTAGILDWGTAITEAVPDVLLAADCVYFEPAFPLLLQTLKECIGPQTVCYFCFKKRRKADLRFMKEAKKLFKVEDVMDDPDRPVWSKESLFL